MSGGGTGLMSGGGRSMMSGGRGKSGLDGCSIMDEISATILPHQRTSTLVASECERYLIASASGFHRSG
jgi:hypothetical protein